MKTNKDFDCVEMKDRVQAEVQRRIEGAGSDEMTAAIHGQLERSHSPGARLGQEIRAKGATTSGKAAASI